MKILLLEDEVMLSTSIAEYLEGLGHRVNTFDDGNGALAFLGHETFDLLILDINVPGIDGLTLLEQLHARKIQTPAIYVSALVEIEDISRAYDLGCHDYLKKPFHLKELALRIDRVMRTRTQPQSHVRLSRAYSFDSENRTLFFHNAPQVLTHKQQQIISLLARNKNRVVDFEMFRHYVWDDAIVDNAVIRAEVNRFKKTLQEDFIVNVRSVGYMIDTE